MEDVHKRPTWDEYFIELVEFIGRRGTCDRGRSGSVIVKDKRIVATGYVGAPIGLKHCDEVGHQMHKVTHEDGTESMHCIRTAHAEQNAISNAARSGVSIEGATLYCKMLPCYSCAKSVINCGIVRVVAMKDYHATKQTKEIFEQAGIEYSVLDSEVQYYPNQ